MANPSLQVELPNDREIVMTRIFDAPRRLVFEALTKPELLKRWLFGPGGWSLVVCEVDLRAGGRLRYEWRHVNGKQMGLSGVFQEVVPPERIVHTEFFDEAWYPGEAIATTVLTERGGKTTLTITVTYESREALEAVVKTRMVDGMAAGYDKLAEVLTSLTE
jgi:uncharacterized protein YndB with AHSA1/START domain